MARPTRSRASRTVKTSQERFSALMILVIASR